MDSPYYVSGLESGIDEKKRVEDARGTILFEPRSHTYRIVATSGVNAALMEVTRSIGDMRYAGKSVIPNIYQVDLSTLENPRVLILACDGLWNPEIGFTKEEAVAHSIKRLDEGVSVGTISKELVDMCTDKKTGDTRVKQDNTTVIVVDLSRIDTGTVESLTKASLRSHQIDEYIKILLPIFEQYNVNSEDRKSIVSNMFEFKSHPTLQGYITRLFEGDQSALEAALKKDTLSVNDFFEQMKDRNGLIKSEAEAVAAAEAARPAAEAAAAAAADAAAEAAAVAEAAAAEAAAEAAAKDPIAETRNLLEGKGFGEEEISKLLGILEGQGMSPPQWVATVNTMIEDAGGVEAVQEALTGKSGEMDDDDDAPPGPAHVKTIQEIEVKYTKVGSLGIMFGKGHANYPKLSKTNTKTVEKMTDDEAKKVVERLNILMSEGENSEIKLIKLQAQGGEVIENPTFEEFKANVKVRPLTLTFKSSK